MTDWQKTYMAVVADALFSRFFPSFSSQQDIISTPQILVM